MKTSSYCYILLLIIFQTSIYGQNDPVLATFKNGEITKSEFIRQIEFSPLLSETADPEEKKMRYLLSMISEQLWAKEGANKNAEQLPIIRYSLKEIKNKYTRDILFEKEITSQISITGEELYEAVRRVKTNAEVIIFTSSNNNEAENLFNKLHTTAPDSLAFMSLFDNISSQKMLVKYGEMEQVYEDSLYSLNPGEFTHPFPTEAGITLFYLTRYIPDPELIDKSNDEILKKAEAGLKKHKSNALYTAFNKKYLGGKEVTADIDLFKRLNNILWGKVLERKGNDSKPVELGFDEIFSAKSQFTSETLNSPFVKFETNPVSLVDFLGYLGFQGIKTEAGTLDEFMRQVSGMIKNFIRLELVTRIAEERGYDNFPEVINETENWRVNYLSSYAMQEFRDSVKITDAEIENYINENSTYQKYNSLYSVTGIKTTSLDKINQLFSLLDDNTNFANKLSTIASSDEIFRYNAARIDSLGFLANYVVNMHINEVFGPVEQEGKYWVFMLTDTSSNSSVQISNPEDEAASLKNELYFKKLADIVGDKTVKLAEKYNLQVNEDLLKNISVNDINIIVMRSFGFGEKMLAAPVIKKNFKWYEKWQEKKREEL